MSGAVLEAPVADQKEDARPLQDDDAPAHMQVAQSALHSACRAACANSAVAAKAISSGPVLLGRSGTQRREIRYKQNVMVVYMSTLSLLEELWLRESIRACTTA